MKKIKLLVIAVGITAMASCSAVADKAVGTYSGSYAIDSTATYPVSGTVVPGSISATKVSEKQVNLLLVCNAPSINDASNGIMLTSSGDDIIFTYLNSTTTEFDMLSLNGTISGNSITVNGVMYMASGSGVGVFTGTK